MKRLFLACTPRTGNLWFRKIVGAALNITDIAGHSPEEIAWDALPEAFLVAMHWHRTPEMERLLDERKIGVIVTMRHPFDVLISILRFCQFEPATARWLEGEGGNEVALMGADPTDARFLNYALSERAAALLSVSKEWRGAARAIVRYEDLLESPHQTLRNVLEALGECPGSSLDAVIEDHAISRLRAVTGHHCWLGQAGLWKVVLNDQYRQAIYDRHREIFDVFGYGIEAAALSTKEALENWNGLLSPQ